jgi:molybdate transport system ATP-binding protein
MSAAQEMEVRLRLPRSNFELDVNLRLPAQGITVLFGASGSGKTSVLRCVAGLERARAARVVVGGVVWQDDVAGIFLPVHHRPLGYVFQEASLFDHLDVQSNLHYGMKRSLGTRSWSEAQTALQGVIELLGIGHLLQRRAAQLSGGERQRVAIARALATAPQLLLLDEPMASLDLARRREILPWLERLRDELRIPMLYVTHAAEELVRLADHLVVLERGTVHAQGAVAQVLASIDPPVIVGEDAGALLQGVVSERSESWHLLRVTFDGGEFWLRDGGWPLGSTVRLRVLASDVGLATVRPEHTSIQNHLRGVVEAMVPDAHPSQVLVRLRCGSAQLLARVTCRAADALGLQIGQPVWLQVKSVAVVM